MDVEQIIFNIKKTCREKHINYKDLLIACNLSETFFTKKKTDLKLSTVLKIANYLNVSIDYLTGRTKNREVLPIIQNLHFVIIQFTKTICLNLGKGIAKAILFLCSFLKCSKFVNHLEQWNSNCLS